MSRYAFRPDDHEAELAAVVEELARLDVVDGRSWDAAVRRHPRRDGRVFSKSEVIRGYRYLTQRRGWPRERGFVRRLRMKPVRTLSGVAPVTVLTKPFPCPGRCVFCPNDVRMPKSYLASEPGAQRAAHHRFDPYAQTAARLRALHRNGHRLDKVELIVLGGTWSFYPEAYQRWFVARCFDALNDFSPAREPSLRDGEGGAAVEYETLPASLDGRRLERSYNQHLERFWRRSGGGRPAAESRSWEELEAAQTENETAAARCVGLVVETRPDHISAEEVLRARRLGATKVQIGVQSLDDEVLAANRRGHDVAATRRAFALLRRAGFKIHAHWMANLLGSSPERDVADFERLFADPCLRPDELKIYPCSLVESAELMAYHERGEWRPYGHDELLDVVVECLRRVPRYCRVTRVIRDIPGDDIVVGNRVTNLRQVAEAELARRGLAAVEIRGREVRDAAVEPAGLEARETRYRVAGGEEVFLERVTADDRLAGYLRLYLPSAEPPVDELAGSAIVREVHVYGAVAGIAGDGGGAVQHRGIGRALLGEAIALARRAGFRSTAVISAVGTREYYRERGFRDGGLYQLRDAGDRGSPGGRA